LLGYDLFVQLSDQIAPLNQRIEAKEGQKSRARRLAEEEEMRISSTSTAFNNDVTALQNIVDSIEEYEKSNSQDDVQRLEAKREILAKKDKRKNEEIERMEPDLNRLAKIVDDQELQRKNLEDNIKIIQSQQKVNELEKELAAIEEEKECVDGRESLGEDQERLRKRNDELIARKARLEGKRGVIVDTIRGLKRKLSQSEYKDVEEDFRIASIKQDTTEMAVKDIDKYHSALDQALQRYHSIKITQINTIIRDLWTLTYKGEDIRNIEIVSGKDAGGRSSRSYNYRVVMSKGSGTMMDMRGRCSAGQRVLASIVIRLALAETFCIKFGCISLDEPTVNLDYKNKKGLAMALAQIIASRSQQSNFQLVLITHDEEFVLMMKSELSTQPNVSMPEKYFQIRREEGMDGKYYSKIDAIDWEELL
jgi:DNA repair protein RAD50